MQGQSQHIRNTYFLFSVCIFFPAPSWPVHHILWLFLICHQRRVAAPALNLTGKRSRSHLTRMPRKNCDVRVPVLSACTLLHALWAEMTGPVTYSTNIWALLMLSTVLRPGDVTVSKTNPAWLLVTHQNKAKQLVRHSFGLCTHHCHPFVNNYSSL